MADPGIVRNRSKIDATISNARTVADLADEGVDLGELLWSFAPPDRVTRARPAGLSDVESVTPNPRRWPRNSSAAVFDSSARQRHTR